MVIYAKPSGGYALSTNEAHENVLYAYSYYKQKGYTDEAISGILANVFHESGLNPWRWESDTVNYSKGYGFFQFTPARGYINGMQSVTGYAPNLSTSQQTSGASTTDLTAQLDVMANDRLGKWTRLCWREGSVYPTWEAEKANQGSLWLLRREILNQWEYTGANFLERQTFLNINNIRQATFAFFACYEGAANIHDVDIRFTTANTIYEIIHGQPPIPPTPSTGKKMKLIYYLRRK